MFGISDVNVSLKAADSTPSKSDDVGQAFEFKDIMQKNLAQRRQLKDDIAIQARQETAASHHASDKSQARNERASGNNRPEHSGRSGNEQPKPDKTAHSSPNHDKADTVESKASTESSTTEQATTDTLEHDGVPDEKSDVAEILALQELTAEEVDRRIIEFGASEDMPAELGEQPETAIALSGPSLEGRWSDVLKQSGVSMGKDQILDSSAAPKHKLELGDIKSTFQQPEQGVDLPNTKPLGSSLDMINFASQNILGKGPLELEGLAGNFSIGHSANNSVNKLNAALSNSVDSPVLASSLSPGQLAARMERAGIATAAVPIDSAKAVTDFSNRIQWMVGRGQSSAEIRLDPPELGSLRVHVTTRDDSTQITFVTQTSAAKDALEQQLPKLREQMENQGLSLGDVDVFDQSSQQEAASEEETQMTNNDSRFNDTQDTQEPEQQRVLVSDGLLNEIA